MCFPGDAEAGTLHQAFKRGILQVWISHGKHRKQFSAEKVIWSSYGGKLHGIGIDKIATLSGSQVWMRDEQGWLGAKLADP